MNLQPKVGVGVLLVKNNEILLGKRKSNLGFGFWAPPGGHLEFGESFEMCARRELNEETGLEIKNVIQGLTTNDIFKEDNKHYITIFMLANYEQGEPKVLEPDKCEGWYWFEMNNLPSPLFFPFANLLKKDFDLGAYL